MIFELDNVELYFKNKRILGGIYLKAETGRVTSILGRNGCGKSCLMNIAFGNLKPKYKLIRLNEKPILKPLYKTKFTKYLPQYNFMPSNVRLSYAFKLYRVNWQNFILEFDAFSKYENSKFGELSGGERRVVETYIILSSKSKIVLLDEPFSHIAPLYIERIKTLIQKEKKNKIILLSDHLYEHVTQCSDSIYLIKDGSTIKINELTELEDYRYLQSSPN